MIDYLDPDKKRLRKTPHTQKKAVSERVKHTAMITEGEYDEYIISFEHIGRIARRSFY